MTNHMALDGMQLESFANPTSSCGNHESVCRGDTSEAITLPLCNSEKAKDKGLDPVGSLLRLGVTGHKRFVFGFDVGNVPILLG